MKKNILFLSFWVLLYSGLSGQVMFTVAGNGTAGYSGDGGTAISSRINRPTGVALDRAGNIYFADSKNNRIRKITTGGVITTIAGTGIAGFSGDGGLATAAQLHSPNGIAIDNAGDIYVTDDSSYRIRKITTTGIITTIAGNGIAGISGDGGLATSAQLSQPTGIVIDLGKNIYISGYSSIRKIDSLGIISTFAGGELSGFSGDGGFASSAKLNLGSYLFSGVAVDESGNKYIADSWNNRIRKVSSYGIITTIAGNGTVGFSGDGNDATLAQLNNPMGITTDTHGNIYFTDNGNNRIRKITATGIITTVAGDGSNTYIGDGRNATAVGLSSPAGIAVDAYGKIYFADNNVIRGISPKPSISSFLPSFGITGTQVTIYGSNFTGASSVTFGGTAASSFAVSSDSTITAIVGAGSSGIIKVANAIYSDTSKTGFTYYTADAPSIKSFTPASGITGTSVTIRGGHFTGTTSVTFGGTPALSYTVTNDSTITAVVGYGSSGIIEVTNPASSDTSKTRFAFDIMSPTVNSFTPFNGTTGTRVTIIGAHFSGTTSVTFGGIPAASYTVYDDTSIVAIVGAGSTGVIKVANSASSDTSKSSFLYVLAPTVKSFTPVSGTTGTSVTISGSHFTGTYSVSFGGTEVSSYSVTNDSTITAIVGPGSIGLIKVTNLAGSDTSKTQFAYNIVAPTVKSFTPASGTSGTSVTISGTHFTGTSSVTFGGTAAASYTVINDSTITAVVGTGSTGFIRVTNPVSSDTSKTMFTFAFVAPTIKSFIPSIGANGTRVTISGSHFSGTSSVSFGGTAATSYTVTSDSTITAIVGTGSTGAIRVTNPASSDTSQTRFTYSNVAVIPVIYITSSLSSFKTCSGIVSPAQSFTVTGSKLSSPVTIFASNNLEISTNQNSYGTSLNLSPVADTIYGTTIYVRLKASATPGIYNDSIAIMSSGASSKSIFIWDTISSLPKTPTIVNYSSLSFCKGGSVLLTDSVSTGNQWFINDSAINGANGISYSATVSGNYTVKATNTSGCTSAVSKVTTVKVNPVPVPYFSIPAACSGRAIYFIDSTTLSDGTQSLSTLNWNFGDGSTSDLKNPIHSYAASANYNVKLIVTSVNGCKDSVSRQVIINPQPQARFTVSNIGCPNIPVSFSDSGSANGSVIKNWKWSFGDSLSNTNNTSQNTTHTYSYPGTYPAILYVTSDRGCTDSTVKSIVINASPSIPAVSPVIIYCQGMPADTLSATLLNGNSLWWYNQASGGTGSAVAPVPSTGVIGKTDFYVSQKNNTTSCESQRANITVNINAYPAVPVITNLGNQLISSASSYYRWYYYDSLIANNTTDTINLIAKGLYKVSTSLDNICWSDSKEYLAQSNPVGTTQKDFQLTVYPNPASSQFYISIKLNEEYSGTIKLSLVNVSGTSNVVYQKYIFNSRKIKMPINFNLNKQVYILTVTINGYVVKTIKIAGI